MKILFAATGEIAVPTLVRLHEAGLVKSVFTAPDAPGKRGKSLVKTPIKLKAEELGIPVSSPEHLGKVARIEASLTMCDTLVSFCYGKIFGPKFLSLFEQKFNIHPSLLPKYRGCAPLYAAIRNGDRSSGITIQDIALGCDEGDIYATKPFDLNGDENEASLSERVAELAAEMAYSFFTSAIPEPRKQEGEASWCTFIKKEDGRLDFTSDNSTLHAQIRSCYPWPKAVCEFQGSPLYLTSVYGSLFEAESESSDGVIPGSVVALDKKKGFKIATGKGFIYVNKLQLPTKKEMDAVSFYNGNKSILGSVLK